MARRLAGIKLLVLDFDGVMTDNRVLVSEDGREAVFCHRGDGMGLARLRADGVEAVVLSTEKNKVVAARCRKLGLECVHGSDDKLAELKAFASRRALDRRDIAYVGNDLNDLACLQWVGLPVAVADAMPDVLQAALRVTDRRGGHGAVREVCDWILAARRSPEAEPK